jgi:RNA-directed DNA polymerase
MLAIKLELRRTIHDPIAKTGAWIKLMLQGHLNDFEVLGNHPSLRWFLSAGVSAAAHVALAA